MFAGTFGNAQRQRFRRLIGQVAAAGMYFADGLQQLFRGRLQLDIDGSVNFNPPEGQSTVPDRRWRVQYSTQCCTFLVEQIIRDFGEVTRDDLYFRVDLTGIGQILRYTYE